MKSVLIFLLLVAFSSENVMAQRAQVFLEDNFLPSVVFLRPFSIVKAPMNYDAASRKMYYMDGERMMVLEGVENVDSVHLGARRFIRANERFLEVCQLEGGKVCIDWDIKNVIVGKRGAYGQRTEGNVQSVRLYDFQQAAGMSVGYTPYDPQEAGANDIYRLQNNNMYYVEIGGRVVKIRTLKQLLKAFPGKETEIRNHISQQNLDMKRAEDALKIIGYALLLAKKGQRQDN